MLAYLAYRFEWRFGLAAVIATAHDILATIAFIGILRLEVSLTVVAAVLSMVGYSLNDTIIIFDRVRENLRKHKKEAFEDILNRSINETLPRSVLTHGTTLASLTGADDLRRRGDPALRPGDVLRRLHRHVLVDLHRLAGAHGHREALARAGGAWAPVRRRPPGRSREAGRRRKSGESGVVARPPLHAHRHPLPSGRSGLRRRSGRGPFPGVGGRCGSGGRDRRVLASADRALAIAATDSRLSTTAGVHPHDADSWNADAERGLRERLRHPGVVAAGEMGLDYHYDHSPRAAQRKAFEAQLALAREAGKPAVIHAREADDDVADILRAHPDVPAILHSFSSGPALLRAGLDLRHYVSFSGMVTFRSWSLDQAILDIPTDRLLLETDGPYLAPVPHRGKRNEPAFVRHVAERIAAIRGVPVDDLIALTGLNAARVFGPLPQGSGSTPS